ncbi:hypothetical protein QEN19_004195 [Hanseniaspora menglaensis]
MSNTITFSKLEEYHTKLCKITDPEYTYEDTGVPLLKKLKKICYSNIQSSTNFSPVCIAILSDVLRLSTQHNNFTNNEINIFFTHLFNQLKNKDSAANYTFAKYAISNVIECDAILLILQLKNSEKFVSHIYDLDNKEQIEFGVSLLNCLIREEDAFGDGKDHHNGLDVYGKTFMNKVIYDNAVCQRVILENTRVFEDFVVRFYNDFILLDDGTFDLTEVYDGDILNQIDSMKHKGFVKLDKLNNLYLKLYQLDKSILNNWFKFLQREILSENKFVRIIAIKMIKNLIKADSFFPQTNEPLFKLLLLRSKDSDFVVRQELFARFDEIILAISPDNKNYFDLLLKNVELGLIDVNAEIRLEVVMSLPKILHMINSDIIKVLIALCRDKIQSIRTNCCLCLCKILKSNTVVQVNSLVATSLLKLYYINDFTINNQLDFFFPEYISYDFEKLTLLFDFVSKDHKAKFCLLSLLTRYKTFNTFLLKYLNNLLNSQNEDENKRIVIWFSRHFDDITFLKKHFTFDLITKLRPFVTGRINIWKDDNLKKFIEFLKEDENIVDEKEIKNFKLLLFKSTSCLFDSDRFYSSFEACDSNQSKGLIDALITDSNCLENLLNVQQLVEICLSNIENEKLIDLNLKRLYSINALDNQISDSFGENVLLKLKQQVKSDPNSLNAFIISEIIPSKLKNLLLEIDTSALKDISLVQLNLIYQNQLEHGVLINKLIPEILTTEVVEEDITEETQEEDDSEIPIVPFLELFNSPENCDLIKSLLLIKSKEHGNNNFAFYKSLVETQGNCILSVDKIPNWWRLSVMEELISVYILKATDSVFYEEFLGDTQTVIQWFAIDSNKYLRKSFFNFIMKHFFELPMSLTFFIFFAADEEDEDLEEYTQFITKNVMNPKLKNEKYFERLTSRYIHNLSYIPSLATIDDDETDRLDVIKDLVSKVIFFLQFVLNSDNCNLISSYCNLIFNYYDKQNAENDCLYLITEIFINVINNFISQKNWSDLKIIDVNELNKIKLPFDLFEKKDNNKDLLLGVVKEHLSSEEKQEVKKICIKTKFLDLSSQSTSSPGKSDNLSSVHSSIKSDVTVKRKGKDIENTKDTALDVNLRRSKRNKKEINYEENKND